MKKHTSSRHSFQKTSYPYFFRQDMLLKDAFKLKRLKRATKEKKEIFEQQALENFEQYQKQHPTRFYLAENLPIASFEQKIVQAFEKHQVLCLKGATGSGKSTQIPKILLNQQASQYGLIGITQPRRLAAQMLFERLKEETFDSQGDLVGWQVRHRSHLKPHQRLKVMTDGILLQEALSDKYLSAYQTIVIDEVHERGVNTDLLLGLLKKALPLRPDLKVLLLSATLDEQTFKDFFPQSGFIEIPGKTFPIEDNFLPLELENQDYWLKVQWALKEAEKLRGDILFFLPTEVEIFRHKRKCEKLFPHWEVLPLFARLDHRSQTELFHSGKKRRLILSTNIAETSLTLPGISVVIDEGTQKIDRFDPSLKMLAYPIVPASKSQVIQRRGRCGRLGPGHCFYLYTQQDFEKRACDLIPAIERGSTDSLVLSLLAMGPDTLETFPFFQKPPMRNLQESLSVLKLLGLIQEDRTLTSLGRKLRSMPLEPRLALILDKAKEYHCLSPICAIVSFFMGEDLRLRPRDKIEQSQSAHQKFRDRRSDFMTLVNIYQAIAPLNGKKLKIYCQENFLHMAHALMWKRNCDYLSKNYRHNWRALGALEKEESFALIHRALSHGLVDKIFYRQEKHYLGPRGVQAFVDRRSKVDKKTLPAWVMAFSLERREETFMNFIGPMETAYVGEILKDSLKVQRKDPFLCPKTGEVVCREDRKIWGLPIIEGRRLLLKSEDKVLARKIFIEQLFRQELWLDYLPGWKKVYQKAQKMTEAARETSLLKDYKELEELALSQFPEQICSLADLKLFEKTLLPLSFASCLRFKPQWKESDFPQSYYFYEDLVQVEYTYDHREPFDGYTLFLEESVFERYSPQCWLATVKGVRRNLCATILDQLPKKSRNQIEDKQDLLEYLTESYELGQPFKSWLLEQLNLFVDQALTEKDLGWAHLDQYLFPYLVLENSEGDFEERGRLYPYDNKPSQKLLKGEQLLEVKDIYLQLSLSAKTGRFYLPCSNLQALEYCPYSFYRWYIYYRQYVISQIYQSLALKERHKLFQLCPSQQQEYFIHLAIAKNLSFDVFEPLSSQWIEKQAQKVVTEYWSDCIQTLQEVELVSLDNAFKVKPFEKSSSPFLLKAAQTLKSKTFRQGLPALFIPRLKNWYRLFEVLKQKQFEKASLLNSLDQQFQELLNSLLLTEPMEKESLLFALYYEWAIATFCQPMKPLKPMSLKKLLKWSEQSDKFRRW